MEMLPRFQPGEVWQHLVRRHDPVTVFMGVRQGPLESARGGRALDCSLPATNCNSPWRGGERWHTQSVEPASTPPPSLPSQVPTMYSKLLSTYEHMEPSHQQQAAAAARRVSAAPGCRGVRLCRSWSQSV